MLANCKKVLQQHIFAERIFSVGNRYVDPAEVGLTDEQLHEIPYTHVE